MTHSSQSSEYFAQALMAGEELDKDSLRLDFGRCHIVIKSNSSALLKILDNYFSPLSRPSNDELEKKPLIEIVLIECQILNLDVEFKDWTRESGKTGKKDAFHNLSDGRLIKKVRTGMLFLQSEKYRIACGPCIKNESQVINFANMQYMIWLQHNNWLICHASAFVYQNKAVGVAAFSGGGKSTFMLKALDNKSVNFLTNDRLFIKTESDNCLAAGIPKMPRINPGTILNNPKLAHILSDERTKNLSEMPVDELWNLEEKYDVLVDEVYGKDRIESEAVLDSIIILNWQRNSSEPTKLEAIEINEHRELLPAIMKSPGSFYPAPNGNFEDRPQAFNEEKYITALANTKIYEVSGSIDFAQLKHLVFSKILAIHEQ